MSVRNHLSSAALLALALGACGPTGGAAFSGEDLYDACENCHGADGAGAPELKAPAIAGMAAWYVEGQLKKFRSGARGAHPDDDPGMRMRPMSKSMPNDEAVAAVAQYVSRLPKQPSVSTLEGADAKRGASYYATCIACHGASAEGMRALNAPALSGANDWYLLTQIRNFKTGLRGADPMSDPTGSQMRAMALTLPSDQAAKDVVAYISTLSR
ncbi:MAG: c-type cytochrome [Nannocystaceae bacterium]